MPGLQELYQDPRFQALDEDKKSNVIVGVVGKDPKFQKLPDHQKASVLNGIMANVRAKSKPSEPQKEQTKPIEDTSLSRQFTKWWNEPERTKARQEVKQAITHPMDTLQGSAQELKQLFTMQVKPSKKVDESKFKAATEDMVGTLMGFAPITEGASLTFGMLKGHLKEIGNFIKGNPEAKQKLLDDLIDKGHDVKTSETAVDSLIKHKEQPAMGAVERVMPTEEKGLTPAKAEDVWKATARQHQAEIEKEFPPEIKAAKKAHEEARAWEEKAGISRLSKEEAFKKAEADRKEQESLDVLRKQLFEEDIYGGVKVPSQTSKMVLPISKESRKFIPKSQGGFASTSLLMHIAGAGIGAALDPDHPIEGAAIGLSASFLLSRGLKGFQGIKDTTDWTKQLGERGKVPMSPIETIQDERQLQSALHMNKTQSTADQIIINKHIEDAIKKGVSPEMDKLFRDASEGSVKLSAKGKALYDQYITPLKSVYQEARAKLHPEEANLIDENIKSRIALGHKTWLDNLLNDEQFSTGGVGGGKFSAKPGSLKPRTVFQSSDGSIVTRTKPRGENQYKYTFWKDGAPSRVEYSSKNLGAKDEIGGVTLSEAKQADIEAHTPIRYVQSDLATWGLRTREMLRYARDKEFVDALIKSKHPDGANLFIHESEGVHKIPSNYRQIQTDNGSLQQFRGYYLPDNMAEALEDFAKTNADKPIRNFISNMVVRGFMLNFIPHFDNEFVHWMSARGITGMLPGASKVSLGTSRGLEGLMQTMPEALMSVVRQDKFQMQLLDKGASLMQPSRIAAEQNDKILQMTLKEAIKTKDFKEMAKAMGVAPFEALKKISDTSGSIMWGLRDTLYTQLVMEQMKMGKSMEDAIAQVGKHMPTYQLPSRMVRGKYMPDKVQRWTAQAMQAPELKFMRYKYGMFRSIGEIGREVSQIRKGIGGAKEFGQGLDRFGALLGMWYFLYPMLDQAFQDFTGNKDIVARRAGALHIAEQTRKSYETGDPRYVALSVLVPDPGTAIPFAVLYNRDPFTGKQIARPEHYIHDTSKYLAGQTMPIKMMFDSQKKKSADARLEIAKLLDAHVEKVKKKMKRRETRRKLPWWQEE